MCKVGTVGMGLVAVKVVGELGWMSERALVWERNSQEEHKAVDSRTDATPPSFRWHPDAELALPRLRAPSQCSVTVTTHHGDMQRHRGSRRETRHTSNCCIRVLSQFRVPTLFLLASSLIMPRKIARESPRDIRRLNDANAITCRSSIPRRVRS